jgi:hypothetical protein
MSWVSCQSCPVADVMSRLWLFWLAILTCLKLLAKAVHTLFLFVLSFQTLLPWLSYHTVVVLSQSPCCDVLAVLPCLSCPGGLCGLSCPVFYPDYPVLAILYRLPYYAVLSVMFWPYLSCPSNSVLDALSWLFCPCRPALAPLSWLSYAARHRCHESILTS